VAAHKPEIVSATDDGKTITVQVRVPDGTTRSMSNSNPAVIQQWLNVKYGLRFPASIARKFVGMPASMAEGIRDLGYDAQSLIMKLRRDVEEKRLQPTRDAVLMAARELAGDMDFAPELLVQQVLGQRVAEQELDEKSTSQAQFRTMAAAAHNPKFARKVGIDTDVAQEFHGADRGQDYKSLPKKANEGELDEGELDEGWKEKVAAAALAGTMALGSAGAQARITPDAQGNFPSSGKPVATQQATTTAPAIPSTLTKPQAQYDVDTQLLTYKGKQYKWNSDAQATGQGEVVSAPAMSIRSRSMFPTKVELNPNGTYTRASVNEAAPKAPDPQNYDSDWDYYNDRDAEEPEDTDADYENMIDEPSDWFDESRQKVGNMDADAFDDALARMKKLAGAGPLKTVYDPARRVYKNVPTAQQPAKQPQK